MTELIRTDEVLSHRHMMDLFGCEEDDDCVQVDGEGMWKRDPCGEIWRFWKFEDAAASVRNL